MKTLKIYLPGIFTCIFLLAFSSKVSAQTEYKCYFQYTYGDYYGFDSYGTFEMGDDPYYCPEYHVAPDTEIYLEPRKFTSGELSGFGSISLYAGNPESYFNYGQYGTLQLRAGQYALLKAEYYTPTGMITKYIYLSSFQ
ncbi:hypothetical protein [Mucilaginibacter sp. PAMB04168]|uniref:hypothetical protein n=1 Tax=Mucilaginibacter sp. PAMB04168 TaxID=3138567 RepID=UPI0031F5F99B